MIRVSRWSRSAYESDADLRHEAAALGRLARVQPPETDAEVLIVTTRCRVDAALLDRAPSARLVVTTTNGTDHLDLGELRRRGIAAARLPEARRDAVAEVALAMLVNGLRRTGTLRAAAEAGRWARADLPALRPRSLRGQPIGVIGLGVIGRRVAELLGALGARVMGIDPRGVPPGVEPHSVDELFASCAAITLHCDLNPTSRGLVDEARLARARPGLVLVNTARGGLVDHHAAIAALDSGRLGALALDVFADEPPLDLTDLARGRPDLWLTPHAAGYHDRLAEFIREGLCATVAAFARGDELPWAV